MSATDARIAIADNTPIDRRDVIIIITIIIIIKFYTPGSKDPRG